MAASAPGTGTIARAVSVSARVEAIDAATREVTLKGPKGKVETITAGPDVRNFDQIKVGDMVVVRYVEALTLTLQKDGKELRAKGEAVDGARSPAGDKPAGIVGRQVEVTADVIAVNAKTQTLTLKGPKRTIDLKVPDTQQFKLVKVGDQIHAVYTEAVALSVEPAKK
jgi:ribosomal protein L6P/L9E